MSTATEPTGNTETAPNSGTQGQASESEQAPATPPPSQLAATLKDARVSLRKDLDVTRHVFRGEVHYVLQDPLTFQSHSFSVEDYAILSQLSEQASLEEFLNFMIAQEKLEESDSESFYQFIFSMHKIGFLKLPVSDGDTLYKRHQARIEAKQKGRFASFLFMPVPLLNPDQLLSRTMRFVRPLCTKQAFYVWCALIAFAGFVLVRTWSDFQRPVADIFSGENLPLLWLTLIGLKVVHEFGHAYSCKYFGGHVPEMGVMLILLTPCAFVDASASWTFSKKSERLMVCMAGMYVELAIAAIALILWSVTPPGIARECLHNIVILASIVTIGFNINPLMRYDGYYALSDLVEIPNLRARSGAYALAVLKKVTLGVPILDSPRTPAMRLGLLGFGVAGAVYKIGLVLGISVAIAFKFFIGGMLLGTFYFGSEIVKIVKRTIPYLWNSDEVRTKRFRARLFGLALIGGLPLAVVAIPVPSNVKSPGVVVGGKTRIVRSEASGFLHDVHMQTGQTVPENFTLVTLREPDKAANLKMTVAELDGARLRERVLRDIEPAEAAQELQRVELLEERLEFNRAELKRLQIADPKGGLIISGLEERDIGRYIKRGEEIASLSSGVPTIRTLLNEEDVAATKPAVGTLVEFRPYSDPTQTYTGRIKRINPTGTRELNHNFTEHLDMAEFAMNPATNKSGRSQFEVEVALDMDAWLKLKHGMTGRVRIIGDTETIGLVWYRKIITLVNRLGG